MGAKTTTAGCCRYVDCKRLFGGGPRSGILPHPCAVTLAVRTLVMHYATFQCASCKDNFRGSPMNGRQCYREVNEADQDICFVPEECARFKQSRPLQPMELSFFVLTPEFSNVDLRIVVDVGQGIVDIFLAVTETFTTKYDATAGCNVLSWRTVGEPVSSAAKSAFMAGMDKAEPCVPGQDSSWTPVKMKGTVMPFLGSPNPSVSLPSSFVGYIRRIMCLQMPVTLWPVTSSTTRLLLC